MIIRIDTKQNVRTVVASPSLYDTRQQAFFIKTRRQILSVTLNPWQIIASSHSSLWGDIIFAGRVHMEYITYTPTTQARIQNIGHELKLPGARFSRA